MGVLNKATTVTTAISAAVLLVLAVGSSWLFSEDSPSLQSALFSPTARVTQGPFEVFVTASAMVDARQSVTLSSELPSNKAKILYLADEGVIIEAGEAVARFDPSPFEADILKYEGEIRELGASLAQSEAELVLLQQEVADRKAEIDYQVILAGLSKSNIERIDIPAREQVARKALTKSEAEYRRASRERSTQEQLFTQGLSRRTELDEARDMEAEKKAAFDIAQRELKTLVEIAFPAERKQAALNLQNRQRAQSNHGEVSRQKTIKQTAARTRLENRIATAQQNLAKTLRYLELTELKAPVTGIVLYKRISQGTEKRKPQVGDSLWNRHAFAVMPDMSSLVAQARVDEKDVGKLQLGQTAIITPQAYRDMRLSGRIDAIGTLADDETDNSSTRYFSVRIALDEPDARLRPGMSARASILASAYSDVTKIPLEAVFYENDLPVSFLLEGGDSRRVELQLGDTDGNHIVVLDGLSVGEQVSLLYPEDADAPAPQ